MARFDQTRQFFDPDGRMKIVLDALVASGLIPDDNWKLCPDSRVRMGVLVDKAFVLVDLELVVEVQLGPDSQPDEVPESAVPLARRQEVAVPAGRLLVSLAYRPLSLRLGLGLAAAAGALLVLPAVAGRRRAQRR